MIAILWIIVFLFILGLISGFILFRRNLLPINIFLNKEEKFPQKERISVIIPARNEELSLPHLLDSLFKQSIQPDEVILVDDHSEDHTGIIAGNYGVKVIPAPDIPDKWTGKNWATWNGYLQSTGDILVFLDADVRLDNHAIQSLISKQKKDGGVISVVPYHTAEKFYEKFAMILNVLGVFAFTSPFEKQNRRKGLYGACIVTTRKLYEKIGGHQSIQSEMLDDLNLGSRFQDAGISVNNYIGGPLVSFRMYPNGIKSELEGFSKGTVLSTASIHPFTLIPVVLWIVGLIVSESCFFFIGTPYFFPLFIGYILYIIQFSYFNRDVGSFGLIHPAFHFLSTIFFFIVVGYSLFQSVFRRKVIWKGRYIHLGSGGKS